MVSLLCIKDRRWANNQINQEGVNSFRKNIPDVSCSVACTYDYFWELWDKKDTAGLLCFHGQFGNASPHLRRKRTCNCRPVESGTQNFSVSERFSLNIKSNHNSAGGDGPGTHKAFLQACGFPSCAPAELVLTQTPVHISCNWLETEKKIKLQTNV